MAENVDYSKVKSDLISYLNSLGKDDGVVDSIVDLLEKVDVPRNPQRRIYCKFYTIALFQNYCDSDDDQEVMLAASGLLKGFEGISKEFMKCRMAYWKHAKGYNNLLKEGWGEATQCKRLGEARERITEYLADAIMLEFSKQNGKLNLAEKYEFPSILELPSPRKSRGDSITWPIYPRKPGSIEPSLIEPQPVVFLPITPPEPSPQPTPPPIIHPDPPKPPNKSKVTLIIKICIIIIFALGATAYITSPLWSDNDTDKGNEEDIEGIYDTNGEDGDDAEGIYDSQVWGNNGDTRPSYTINEINAGVLGNQITFNTISDSVIGNEKNFVGARKYTGINAGEDSAWEGNDIVVEDGKEYIIRLYVHNNNRDGYDGIAEDTRVSFSIPTESSAHIAVYGFIMSSNATPSKYWDYVIFHAPTAFHLEYMPGSALLENNGIGEGGLLLSDAVVDAASGGSPIGFDSLDGRIPGGYTYDSYISIRVKAIFDVAYTLETQVRLVGGDKTWDNGVEAQIGDKVEFRMAYKNNDAVDHLNVMISTVLPEGLRYVPGSTKLVNGNYPNGATIDQDDITTRGINIGSYSPGANAFVRFQAEVVDEGLEHGSNTLVNWGQASVKKTCLQDYATVHLMKD